MAGDILCSVGPKAPVAGERRECGADGAVGHLTARDQRGGPAARSVCCLVFNWCQGVK